MKITSKLTDERFIIAHERRSVVIFILLMAAACIGVGVVFILVPGASIFAFKVFGYIFLAGGALCLLGLPRQLQAMARDDGTPIFIADKEGVVLYALADDKQNRHPWGDIERIVFAKYLENKWVFESDVSSHLMLIFFRKDALGGGILEGPGRVRYVVLDYDKNNVAMAQDAVKQFSGNKIAIACFQRVIFNNNKKTVEFVP